MQRGRELNWWIHAPPSCEFSSILVRRNHSKWLSAKLTLALFLAKMRTIITAISIAYFALTHENLNWIAFYPNKEFFVELLSLRESKNLVSSTRGREDDTQSFVCLFIIRPSSAGLCATQLFHQFLQGTLQSKWTEFHFDGAWELMWIPRS